QALKTVLRAQRSTTVFSPPPLRGRVREGGIKEEFSQANTNKRIGKDPLPIRFTDRPPPQGGRGKALHRIREKTVAILNGSVTAERAINLLASRQLALRAEDCTARARQLASAFAKALGRVFS